MEFAGIIAGVLGGAVLGGFFMLIFAGWAWRVQVRRGWTALDGEVYMISKIAKKSDRFPTEKYIPGERRKRW